MKVLHVTADWKWTGPAEPMLHAVAALRARGVQAELACPEAPPGLAPALAARARERGIAPVLPLERARGIRPWRDRGEIARLRALLADGGYRVVHAHHTRDHWLARRAAGGLGVRVVVSWHGGDPIPRLPWNRLRFGRAGADGVAVLSEGLAEATRRWLGLDASRVAVVPGAVDAARFAPRPRSAALAASLGLEPGARVIGLVARLQRHRRVELLLDALVRARRDAPGLRLLVVGRGTHAREVLEEPVRRLGLDGVVVRAGYRGHDYPDALALCDALVFLVPGSDGSCRALLEAMAMEIPAIATRRGILPETVADGECGRLVDEDAGALAAQLASVWKDPELWRARGRAARCRVLERHTPELAAERLERLYASVLASSS
jgi:glycosyltransferase involved in cell wall biosynthesis